MHCQAKAHKSLMYQIHFIIHKSLYKHITELIPMRWSEKLLVVVTKGAGLSEGSGPAQVCVPGSFDWQVFWDVAPYRTKGEC